MLLYIFLLFLGLLLLMLSLLYVFDAVTVHALANAAANVVACMRMVAFSTVSVDS